MNQKNYSWETIPNFTEKNEKRHVFKGATRKKEGYVQNIRHIYER